MTESSHQDNSILVIGIGNEYRGDDAVGLYVARGLEANVPPGCDIKQSSGDGASLVNCWEGYNHVVIIDAVRSTRAPGSIIRIDALAQPLPEQWVHHSAHTVSLPEAVALARTLGTLPETLIVYGIEGACFDPGASMNDSVRQAGEDLIRTIADELRKLADSD